MSIQMFLGFAFAKHGSSVCWFSESLSQHTSVERKQSIINRVAAPCGLRHSAEVVGGLFLIRFVRALYCSVFPYTSRPARPLPSSRQAHIGNEWPTHHPLGRVKYCLVLCNLRPFTYRNLRGYVTDLIRQWGQGLSLSMCSEPRLCLRLSPF